MKNIAKFTLLLIVFIGIASCEKAPTILFNDEITSFKLTNNASIHMNGDIVYEFDDERHQVVYTSDSKMYMVTNMEQTEFYSLTMTSTPRLYVTANVKVKSVGIDSVKPAVYTMEVIQKSDDKIWLWDEKSSVGFVLDLI